jgi:hypothetical protein
MASLLLATYGGCLLAILLLFLWRELRIEVFRQRIFQIRDELFDFAAEGNISFNDPAYGALRTSMNSLIRFAHKMSFFHAFLMNLARHWYPSPALERAFKQRMRPLDELPEGPVRDKLHSLHRRYQWEMFRFAFPLASLLIPIASHAVGSLYSYARKKRDEIAETIEVQANECDELSGRSLGEPVGAIS